MPTFPKNKGFNIKKGKINLGFGDLGTDKYGERDFSPHNISARRTEGTIAEQKARRESAPPKFKPYTPFKMKAADYGNSPMKKNFGNMIGGSPLFKGRALQGASGALGSTLGSLQKNKDILQAQQAQSQQAQPMEAELAQSPEMAMGGGGGVPPHGPEAHTGPQAQGASVAGVKPFKGRQTGQV